ncbi:Cytochrome P450 3A5 [Halotydeus destructor]|nr:Cytochrome P450 3A5 [Halotydeus destructor]
MTDLSASANFTNISVLIASSMLIYGYLWYRRTYSFWSRRGVRGPTPLPFVGNMWPLFFNSYKKVDMDNFKKYGHVYGYYDGTLPVLAVSDPAILEKIYVTNWSDFPEFLKIESPDPLENHQMPTLEGKEWKRQRKVISNCFSGSKMKTASENIAACQISMIDYLRTFDGKEVDAKKVFRLHALDVVGKVFYSIDVDAFNNQDSQLVSSVGDFFSGFTAWNFFVMGSFPSWAVPYFAQGFVAADAMAYMKQFVVHIVNGKKAAPDKRDDLVQVLIDATTDEETIKKDGKGLSEIEVLANAIGMFGASYDTTTSAMSRTAWFLAHHPDVQERIMRDINDICKSESVTYEDLSQMHYLEAVVTETLRIEAVDTRGFRRTVRETVIPGTDIVVPGDQLISACFYPAHYDERYFDEPDKFKPERYLDDTGNKNRKLPFFAFGGGQRMCAGTRLAYLGIKQSLATILRRFKIEKGPNTPNVVEQEAGTFMMNPDNLFIRFVER